MRQAIQSHDRSIADRVISKKLRQRDEWRLAHCVCIYISTPEEVDTRQLMRQQKQFVVPRVAGKMLTLHRFGGLEDLVPVSTIDLFIVPGIAFDLLGFRLGWGKGYYDRLLVGVTVPKIGLAYNCQIVPRLPRRSYDIPMDIVITEHETLSP